MLTAADGDAGTDGAALETVVLTGGITEIDNEAFGSCPSLTEITIPGSVKRIGAFAFGNGCGHTPEQVAGGFHSGAVQTFMQIALAQHNISMGLELRFGQLHRHGQHAKDLVV